MKEWSDMMNCAEEQKYPTSYDGVNGFECFERKCQNETSIVSCVGEYEHNYPLWEHNQEASAEIAWEFMKNHKRR